MTNPGNRTSLEIRSIKNKEEFIVRIRQIILQHIKEDGFGVRMLCKLISMSRTQLHIRMKSATGRSTSHYIRFVRIEKACQFLLETDLNISQVSLEIGIDSLSYFSRIFTKEMGLSPHNYRVKFRSEQ